MQQIKHPETNQTWMLLADYPMDFNKELDKEEYNNVVGIDKIKNDEFEQKKNEEGDQDNNIEQIISTIS
jgi:hypothetical protein